jgi:uncharacterized protein
MRSPFGEWSLQQFLALATPLILIPSMWWAFQQFDARAGYPGGYLAGYVVYWLVWCTAVPAALLGGFGQLRGLFRPVASFSAMDSVTHLLLWWSLAFPLVFIFLPRVRAASVPVLLVSLALGIVIAVTEEVLWRGVYVRLFPDNPWLSVVYASIMFGLWHLAPQSVVPNRLPGGWMSFVGYAESAGLLRIMGASPGEMRPGPASGGSAGRLVTSVCNRGVETR